MNKPSKSKGFVLAELIVAIALLAVVSGLILQLFILASATNEKARDLDSASSAAATMMESIKCSGMDFSGEAFALANVNQSEDHSRLVFNLDADWHMAGRGEQNPYATMTVDIVPAKQLEGLPAEFGRTPTKIITGILYDIDIAIVIKDYKTLEEKTIVELHGAKYLPGSKNPEGGALQ